MSAKRKRTLDSLLGGAEAEAHGLVVAEAALAGGFAGVLHKPAAASHGGAHEKLGRARQSKGLVQKPSNPAAALFPSQARQHALHGVDRASPPAPSRQHPGLRMQPDAIKMSTYPRWTPSCFWKAFSFCCKRKRESREHGPSTRRCLLVRHPRQLLGPRTTSAMVLPPLFYYQGRDQH